MENDLIRSRITGDEAIDGSRHLKTIDNMERYPLIHETDNFRFECKYKRKSATFGNDGLDTECPSFLHQALNTFHLA